jgi:hypothetical protein
MPKHRRRLTEGWDGHCLALILVAIIVIATAVYVLFGSFGCVAAGGDLSGIKATLDQVAADVSVVKVAVTKSAGRDVNEPVTGWILAVGYASAPLSILVYLVGHRLGWFRKLTDKLKGK